MTYKYNVATTVGGNTIFYHPLTVPVNCRSITMNTIAISQSERPKTIYLMNDLNGSYPMLVCNLWYALGKSFIFKVSGYDKVIHEAMFV